MISPNLSDNGPRLPPNYYHKSPPSPDTEKTERVAAMNKITNFSIAAIMNSRNRRDPENDEDEFEAKRRKLAEAVPALGKNLFLKNYFLFFRYLLCHKIFYHFVS